MPFSLIPVTDFRQVFGNLPAKSAIPDQAKDSLLLNPGYASAETNPMTALTAQTQSAQEPLSHIYTDKELKNKTEVELRQIAKDCARKYWEIWSESKGTPPESKDIETAKKIDALYDTTKNFGWIKKSILECEDQINKIETTKAQNQELKEKGKPKKVSFPFPESQKKGWDWSKLDYSFYTRLGPPAISLLKNFYTKISGAAGEATKIADNLAADDVFKTVKNATGSVEEAREAVIKFLTTKGETTAAKGAKKFLANVTKKFLADIGTFSGNVLGGYSAMVDAAQGKWGWAAIDSTLLLYSLPSKVGLGVGVTAEGFALSVDGRKNGRVWESAVGGCAAVAPAAFVASGGPATMPGSLVIAAGGCLVGGGTAASATAVQKYFGNSTK